MNEVIPLRHYLLIYDRNVGKIIRHQEYDEAHSALDARFDAERKYSGRSEIEVVVLGAESWESLSQTHARYFKNMQELAMETLSRIHATPDM